MARGQSASFMRKIRALRGKRKINKRSSVQLSMPKRRRFSRARGRVKRYVHRGSDIKGIAIGTALYSAYKIFLAPEVSKLLPNAQQYMPFVEVAGGYLLAKTKNPYMRDFGKVAFAFGLFQLVNQYVVPMIPNSTSGTMPSVYY